MFTIIHDTKEKKPWEFRNQMFRSDIQWEMTPGALKTGDYTVYGFEAQIVIERKASTGELAGNIGVKKKQFTAELERMQKFPYRAVVCEFTMDDVMRFPEGSGIPRKLWPKLRIHPNYLATFIKNFKLRYDIEFFLCYSREEAEDVAFKFLKDSYDKIIARGCA